MEHEKKILWGMIRDSASRLPTHDLRESSHTRVHAAPRTLRSWMIDAFVALTAIAGLGLITTLTAH